MHFQGKACAEAECLLFFMQMSHSAQAVHLEQKEKGTKPRIKKVHETMNSYAIPTQTKYPKWVAPSTPPHLE